jgi:hypothetical protein
LGAAVEKDCVAYTPAMRLRLAMVLLRRDEAGDRERAAALLADARAEAVAIGATGIVERVDALID